MEQKWVVEFTDKDHVSFPGRDLGQEKYKIVKESFDLLILKIPGYNYWMSMGETGYAHAEYLILKLVLRRGDNRFIAEEVIRFPTFPITQYRERRENWMTPPSMWRQEEIVK